MRIKEKARALNAYSQRSSLTANNNLFLKLKGRGADKSFIHQRSSLTANYTQPFKKRKCPQAKSSNVRGYKDESGEPLTPSQTLSIRYYKRARAKSQPFFPLNRKFPAGVFAPRRGD